MDAKSENHKARVTTEGCRVVSKPLIVPPTTSQLAIIPKPLRTNVAAKQCIVPELPLVMLRSTKIDETQSAQPKNYAKLEQSNE